MRDLVRVRASALPDALDCAARFEARHLLGMKMPTGPAARLGTAIHRSTAVFDQARHIDGDELSADDAAGEAVDTIHAADEEEVAWDDDLNKKTAESIAVALHTRYCEEVSPVVSYAAVEVACDSLKITDIGLELTGTTDRVMKQSVYMGVDSHPIEQHDSYGIGDLKTGKRAVGADGHVETKGAAFQIGVYELLAEHGSGLAISEPARIIGLQTGKTEKGQRVGISEGISGARDVLIGDEEQRGVLETVANMIHEGNFPGNPRSYLCHQKYCPIYDNCRFRM